MLPGEPDAAKDLDGVTSRLEEGLRTGQLGERGCNKNLLRIVDSASSVIGGGLRVLNSDQDVGTCVFHCLKRADGTPKLVTGLGVVYRGPETPLGPANLLQRKSDEAEASDVLDDGARRAFIPQKPLAAHTDLFVNNRRLSSGDVERFDPLGTETSTIRGNEEQTQTTRSPGSRHHRACDMTEKHIRLGPIENPIFAIGNGRQGNVAHRSRMWPLKESNRHQHVARGNGWQKRFLLSFAPRHQDRIRSHHHRREERPGVQRATDLLQDDAQLHEGIAGSSVLLRNRQ